MTMKPQPRMPLATRGVLQAVISDLSSASETSQDAVALFPLGRGRTVVSYHPPSSSSQRIDERPASAPDVILTFKKLCTPEGAKEFVENVRGRPFLWLRIQKVSPRVVYGDSDTHRSRAEFFGVVTHDDFFGCVADHNLNGFLSYAAELWDMCGRKEAKVAIMSNAKAHEKLGQGIMQAMSAKAAHLVSAPSETALSSAHEPLGDVHEDPLDMEDIPEER